MENECWSFFHDGGIESISASPTGEVTLFISIQYLRQQFPGEGVGFVVKLRNCTEFEYQEYDRPALTDNSEIVAASPEILSFERTASLALVHCVMGTLRLRYSSATICLDSGVPVTVDELSSASKAYWTDWAERNRHT